MVFRFYLSRTNCIFFSRFRWFIAFQKLKPDISKSKDLNIKKNPDQEID